MNIHNTVKIYVGAYVGALIGSLLMPFLFGTTYTTTGTIIARIIIRGLMFGFFFSTFPLLKEKTMQILPAKTPLFASSLIIIVLLVACAVGLDIFYYTIIKPYVSCLFLQ